MGGMFGKQKRVKVSQPLTTLNRLKQHRDNIIEDQLETEDAIDMDRQKAQQLLSVGRRDEAKKVLMRKRYRERQLQRSNAQLDKIDQLTDVLEVMTELGQVGKEKANRGKWKLLFKKHKKRHQSTGLQSTVDAENIEFQNLDGFKKIENQKIFASTKEGIEKQKKIDDVIFRRLRTNTSTAVEAELEAILNEDYQLPDIRQENISNTVEINKFRESTTVE